MNNCGFSEFIKKSAWYKFKVINICVMSISCINNK